MTCSPYCARLWIRLVSGRPGRKYSPMSLDQKYCKNPQLGTVHKVPAPRAGRGLQPPFREIVLGTEEPATIPASTPVLYAIILINVVVYIITSYRTMFTQTTMDWISRLGFVPAEFLVKPEYFYKIFTAMFTHADIFHIFFNMYFLYIFGRAVERTLGSARFAALYLIGGVFAAIFHTVFTYLQSPAGLAIPSVGASGAISAVLGAYMVMYPGSRLAACFFIFLFPVCFEMLAAYYLLFWFAIQVLEGYFALNSQIAFFAHAGGFLAGIALLPIVADRSRIRMLQLLRTPVLFGGILRFIPWRYKGLSPAAKTLFASLALIVLGGSIVSYMMFTTSPALLAGYNIAWRIPEASLSGTDRFYLIAPQGAPPIPVVETTASIPGRIVALTLKDMGALTKSTPILQQPLILRIPLSFYSYATVYVIPLEVRVSYTSNGLLEKAELAELVQSHILGRFHLGASVNIIGEANASSILRYLTLATIVVTLASLYIVMYRDADFVIAPELV